MKKQLWIKRIKQTAWEGPSRTMLYIWKSSRSYGVFLFVNIWRLWMVDRPSHFSGLLSLLAWLSFQKFCWNGINNISCRHRATWSHTSPNKSRSLSTLYIHDDTAATTTTSITANSFFLPSPPSSTVENIDVGYIWYNIDADDDRKLRRGTNMW